MPESTPKGPTKSAGKPAKTLTLTVRLTPRGFAEARRQLDQLEETTKAQAWSELRELMVELQAQSGYTSEEEALADAEAAVREVRQERRAQR